MSRFYVAALLGLAISIAVAGSKVLAERQLRREISSATGAIPTAAVVLEILKKCIVGEVCDPRRGLRHPERAR